MTKLRKLARAAAAAWLFSAPAMADCGVPGSLLDALGPVGQATAILERVARAGAPGPGDANEARRLAGDLDRLLAQRDCYLDRIDTARALAAGDAASEAAALLPTLRRQRDALHSYRDELPDDFASGRDTLTATVQSLNLAIAAEAERNGGGGAEVGEVTARLLLHAAVSARIAFAHAETAKARLEAEILGRSEVEGARETAAALAGLDAFVGRALAYNGHIVSHPGLERRMGKTMARGAYSLGGARFDSERHCRLAEFKAAQALESLAARLGVVVRGEVRESCAQVGDRAVVWLSAPEEKLVRFR